MALPAPTKIHFQGHHPPLKMTDKNMGAPSSFSRQPIDCSGEVLPENIKKEKKREGRF
jgi:hypothetical protein